MGGGRAKTRDASFLSLSHRLCGDSFFLYRYWPFVIAKRPMRRPIEKRKTTTKTPPAEASGIVMR